MRSYVLGPPETVAADGPCDLVVPALSGAEPETAGVPWRGPEYVAGAADDSWRGMAAAAELDAGGEGVEPGGEAE